MRIVIMEVTLWCLKVICGLFPVRERRKTIQHGHDQNTPLPNVTGDVQDDYDQLTFS